MKTNLLNRLALTTVLLSLLSAPVHADAPADPALHTYRQRQDDMTPGQILDWLKEGNRRFVAGASTHGGYVTDARERIRVSSQGQRPLAAILSCIDSRTTPELAFDTSVGDLFTARVGANVINDDVLGSLEIAAASGAKVILILGHTDCGGVKGALNNLDLGHVTAMLAKVKPAIASFNGRLDADPALSAEVGPRLPTNRRYVAEVSHENARHSHGQVLTQSPVLKDLLEKGEILLLSAEFDVDTGAVSFDRVR